MINILIYLSVHFIDELHSDNKAKKEVLQKTKELNLMEE